MNILELFQNDFFVNTLLVGLLISISCGIIGTLIVSSRLSFLAGGIAHSAYAGIGIGFYFGFNPTIGAVLVGSLFSVILGIISFINKHKTDTIISVIWAVGMAIGIVFIDLTKGYEVDLMSWLFGSIIAVSSQDLIISLILDFIIVTTVFLFYKEFTAMIYDMEYAKICGIKVKLFYMILLVLTSLTIVILIQMVGLILVIAMLTIPSLIAEKFMHSMFKIMIMSSILCLIFVFSGIFISYVSNLSLGATIILISAAVYALSFFIKFIKNKIIQL